MHADQKGIKYSSITMPEITYHQSFPKIFYSFVDEYKNFKF